MRAHGSIVHRCELAPPLPVEGFKGCSLAVSWDRPGSRCPADPTTGIVRERVRKRVRVRVHVRVCVCVRMLARVRVRVRVHAHALCACDICVSLHVRVKFRDWKYLSNEKSFEMEHVSHAHTHTRATKNSAYTRQPTADLHGQHHTGSILDVWQRHSICISSISNLKSIC